MLQGEAIRLVLLQELSHERVYPRYFPRRPFINYLINPQLIANISNFIGFANANSAASPLLDASTVADTAIYPAPDQQQRLFVQMEDSPEQTRAITGIWQKFKTAQ